MRGQGAKRSAKIAFAVIAVIVTAVWVYKVWFYPRPFWCANTDVEVDYFFNGLQVAAGKPPVNFVHPGTPIQYLSGLLSWLTHAQPADMQRIMNYGYLVGLAVTLGAMWLFLRIAAAGLPGWAGVAIAASLFVNPAALFYLTYFSGEMFLVACGLLVFWSWWQALFELDVPRPLRVILSGVLVGFACAVKLVFVPLVAAGLLGYTVTAVHTTAIHSPRYAFSKPLWACWVAACLGFLGLLLCTTFWHRQPQIAMLLWAACVANVAALVITAFGQWVSTTREAPHIRRWLAAIRMDVEFVSGVLIGWLVATWPIFHWYGAMLSYIRAGSMGSFWDPTAVTGLREWMQEFMRLTAAFPWWGILAVAALAFGVGEVVRLQWMRRTHAAGTIGLGAAIIGSLLLGLLAGLKNRAGTHQPYVSAVDLRWFIPAAVAASSGLAWLAQVWIRRAWRPRSIVTAVAPILTGLVCVGLASAVRYDLRAHHQVIAMAHMEKQIVDERLTELSRRIGRPPVILTNSFGLWRPSASLRQGSFYVSYRYKQEIDQLYPTEGEIRLTPRVVSLPEGASQFDLIIIKESELNPDDMVYLHQLGTVERWADGLPSPLIVVKASPS